MTKRKLTPEQQQAKAQYERIRAMTDADLALSDADHGELMDLFRLARNGDATTAEVLRCRELMWRVDEIKRREQQHRKVK